MARVEHIGDAALYLGDCRDVLPGLAVGVVIFDPPYGVSHASNRVAATTTARWMRTEIANDDTLEIRDFVLGLHKGQWAAFATIKRPAPDSYRGCLVWDKGPAAGMGDLSFPWKPSWELIYVNGDGWSGYRDEGVLRHVSVSRASMGRTHPNEKPVELMRALIQKAPAGVVCDPTMGTGATGVAAAMECRRFIGIEIEPRYFDIACRRIEQAQRRIEQAQRQKDLFIHAPVPEPPEDARMAADLFAWAAD